MPLFASAAVENAYLNPVYTRNVPDPFVLVYGGEYWAYGTGFWHDGRCFGILHSRDLIHWRELEGAMEPLPVGATCYWAPEVTYYSGRFFMYYSVGNEELMEIRVAVAEHPAGPFVDCGRRLTGEPFAIDPHVFMDDNGDRYLFYATDFLERERVGTGTVCDQLFDPFTLAGEPRPVALPRYDWQIYDPQRAEKGGVRWHTIEGPFVLKHKGFYYQMFSGGNWQNAGYGVSYATTDDIRHPAEWTQVCDGERVLPILRTIPGEVIGPGHNSVVRGPDNRQLFCVYHRWDEARTRRQLAIDRLEWVGEQLRVLGPSYRPQPVPRRATFADYFERHSSTGLGADWDCSGGQWRIQEGAAMQTVQTDASQAKFHATAPCFVAETYVRPIMRDESDSREVSAACGIALHSEQGNMLHCLLRPYQNQAMISWRTRRGWHEQKMALPAGLEPWAYQRMCVEVDHGVASVVLGEAGSLWSGRIQEAPTYRVALRTERMAATFTHLALTVGWQDWFVAGDDPLEQGWQCDDPGDHWRIGNKQLWHLPAQETGMLSKGPLLQAYEWVANARLSSEHADGAVYGFFPALAAEDPGPLLTVERAGGEWAILWRERGRVRRFPLPAPLDPGSYQQFRFLKEVNRLHLQWNTQVLGTGEIAPTPARIGLFAQGVVAFDGVRVTALPAVDA